MTRNAANKKLVLDEVDRLEAANHGYQLRDTVLTELADPLLDYQSMKAVEEFIAEWLTFGKIPNVADVLAFRRRTTGSQSHGCEKCDGMTWVPRELHGIPCDKCKREEKPGCFCCNFTGTISFRTVVDPCECRKAAA